MLKDAKELLDLCERRFPSPRKDQRHSLFLEKGTLVLTLMMGDTYQRFNFDNEDLSKAPAQILAELIAIFRTNPPPTSPDGPISVA